MVGLTLIEKLFVVIANKNGNIDFKTKASMSFAVASVMELYQNQVIKIMDDKVLIDKELKFEHMYLKPVYDFIKSKKPYNASKVCRAVWKSNSTMKALFDAVKSNLKNRSVLEDKKTGFLFIKKKRCVVTQKAYLFVLDRLKVELGAKTIDFEGTICFVALLFKARLIKKIFDRTGSSKILKWYDKISAVVDHEFVTYILGYIEKFFAPF